MRARALQNVGEEIFAQHDAMIEGLDPAVRKAIEEGDNVEPLHAPEKAESAG